MRINQFWYRAVCIVVRAAMFFWHPVFRVEGALTAPAGRCIVCCNHCSMADPIWVVFGIKRPQVPRIMAKEQLMHVPLLKGILRWLGIIPIKRGASDLAAIKTSIQALRAEETLLIFPEGTRARNGEHLEGKTGAVMLAARTNSPILPVYLQTERHPLSKLRMVVGAPYHPAGEGAKLTAEELRRLTGELMDKIYALGETP